MSLDQPAGWQADGDDYALIALTLLELEELDIPEVTWLVQDLLPTGSLALLAGRPKAGKSLLAIDLLASVATGESFLGHAIEPGSALYVPAEDALGLVRERLFTRLGDERDVPVAVIPADGSFNQDIQIDDPHSFRELIEVLAALEPSLLILDPFRELHRQVENEAEGMAAILRPLRQLAHATGCTILLIHHRNKHATDPALAIRGSSAIAGSVDVTITLDVPGDGGDYASGQVLHLNVEGRYAARKRLSARLGDQLRWELIETDDPIEATAYERVLELLKASASAMTADQLAMETGLAKKTIQNAFSSLRAADQIERVETGSKLAAYRYSGSNGESPVQPAFDPF